MGLTIREKAEYVGTLRGTRVFLMEMLSQWTPTTPELEAKVLFGRHIWDTAQHADALGKRALELRAPLHYTLPPTAKYADVLSRAAAQTGTAERIQCLYEVILPGLATRHSRYLANTDRLQDEPTVRIIEAIQRDDARMIAEAQETLAEINHLELASAELLGALRAADAAASDFVTPGEGVSLARGVT
jgi:hypothetical protein